MQNSPVIIIKHLCKIYSAHLFQKPSRALDGVSLNVHKGEVFGIVGPNGAGKSTLLKIVLGFVHSSTGTTQIMGLPPHNPNSRLHIGYLPETNCLYSHLSLYDHLLFAGRLRGLSSKLTKKRIDILLDQVGLQREGKKIIRHYSKGMTQRAALAYALFHQPEILILDEPMSGLDPVGRQLVVDLIHRYNDSGNTILFCSHILTDVERICHRIGIMDKGKLKKIICPEALPPVPKKYKNKSPLEAFFFQTIKTNNNKGEEK